jgi:TIR domain
MELLEFSRDHAAEIEVLSDSKALFLLTLIADLGNTTREALSSHLGWDSRDIERLWHKLTNAELVRDESAFDRENPIRLSTHGKLVIAALRFPGPQQPLLDRMDINAWIRLVQDALAGIKGLQDGLNERLAEDSDELAKLTDQRVNAEAARGYLENVLIELNAAAAAGAAVTMLSDDDVAKLDALAGNLDRATLRNFALNAGLDAVGNTIQSFDSLRDRLVQKLDQRKEPDCRPPLGGGTVGIPDDFIVYAKSPAARSSEFHSCFISYSTKDQDFADRLYEDLQANGIRCWYAPHDVQAGRKLHEQIDDAIRVHEKLLLILSPHSMSSEWVKTEIAKATKRESREHVRMLFPISLAPFDAICDWECFDADTGRDSAREIREFFIPDFSKWTEHDSYQQAFDRLLRDLKSRAAQS